MVLIRGNRGWEAGMKALKIVIGIVVIAAAGYYVYHKGQQLAAGRLNNEAVALLDADRFADALEKLLPARRKDPANASVWKNLGIAYEGLGRVPEAIAAYERSLALRPNQPEIRSNVDLLKSRGGGAGTEERGHP
jgi:Flp pilus assembly protein TadD